MTILSSALTLASMLAAMSLSHADELIVDASGQGDFTTIQAAVDASLQGDIILVRPGIYPEDVLIDGRSVWLLSQAAGTVTVEGTLNVQNLAPDEEVAVLEIDFRPNSISFGAQQPNALNISNAAGHVRLQGCAFHGAAGSSAIENGGHGVRASSSLRVTLLDCELRGGDGVYIGPSQQSCATAHGGAALWLFNSRAASWGMTAFGGKGTTCQIFGPAGNGGPGVHCSQSQIYASGGDLRGGAGGDANDFIPATGGDGGAGLILPASSDAWFVETTTVGGAAGSSWVGSPGQPGPAVSGNGTLVVLAGISLWRSAAKIVRASEQHAVSVRGVVGAPVTLHFIERPPFYFDLVANGAAGGGLMPAATTIPTPLASATIGTIPAGGVLNTLLGIPAIPAGLTSLPVTLHFVTGPGLRNFRHSQPILIVAVNCDTLQPDCNMTSRADLCELLEGAVFDCDGNGIPDDCQPDCNANGVADTCDIANNTSDDLNNDGIPDECQQNGVTHYVDDSAPPGGNGTFGMPFDTLGAAVSVSLTGDEIIVMDGVYTGPNNKNLEFDARLIRIRSQNGPANCTIDLEGDGRAFYWFNEPNNFGAIIEGLRIINGAPSGTTGTYGGAIHAVNSSPTIRGCVFENNEARTGGAIYLTSSFSLVEDCQFFGNLTTLLGSPGGAGLFADSGGPVIRDCSFIGNISLTTGGAIALIASSTINQPTVSRCVIFENSAGLYGGGISSSGFSGTAEYAYIDQCLIAGNTAAFGGGVSGAGGGSMLYSNCTIVGNVATDTGGGMCAQFNLDPVLLNSIVRGNSAPSGAQLAVIGSGSTLLVEYCNLEGGAPGIFLSGGGAATAVLAVVDADPLFVDDDGADNDPLTFTDNDYHLGNGSPSIDAASNDRIPADRADADNDGDLVEPVPIDLDGLPRRLDDPAAADTGQGTAPIVDHGVFEKPGR